MRHTVSFVSAGILLPAPHQNRSDLCWPQLDFSWYSIQLNPISYGRGQPASSHRLNSPLAVDGPGCMVVETDNHNLIARGLPVAQLLEFQWEDSLLAL